MNYGVSKDLTNEVGLELIHGKEIELTYLRGDDVRVHLLPVGWSGLNKTPARECMKHV